MAVFTQLDEAHAARILGRFGINQVLGLASAKEGIENTNYFIRAAGADESNAVVKEYVLTLIEPVVSKNRSAALMILVLDTCRRNGLPVPSLVRTTEGGFIVSYDGKPALLATRISGEHVKQPSPDHCAQIGSFLGRLHLATKAIAQSAALYSRDASWLRKKASTVIKNFGWGDRCLLEQEVCHADSMLARRDVNDLPSGLIHGDLFRDNALFCDDKLTGVLDFHHASRGYWIYDLAMAINDWCGDDGSLDRSRALALLRGYHSIRLLEEVEMVYLHGFLRYAALSFWLSRSVFSLRSQDQDAVPNKDPQQLRNLIIEYLRSPWQPEWSALATA